MTQNILDFEIRIFSRREDHYPVHITLGDGREFQGILAADIEMWAAQGDAVKDGSACRADSGQFVQQCGLAVAASHVAQINDDRSTYHGNES